MASTVILMTTKLPEVGISAGYMAGAAIALFILAYLLYALIKPDKF